MRPSSANPRTRVPQRPSSASIYTASIRTGNAVAPSLTPRQRPTVNRAALDSSNFASTVNSLARTLPQISTTALQEDTMFARVQEHTHMTRISVDQPVSEPHQSAAASAARTFLESCRRRGEDSSDAVDTEAKPVAHRVHVETEVVASPRGSSQRSGDSNALLAAVAFLDQGDYAAAFRAFSQLEASIASVLSTGSTTSDDRVAACRYFLNFGVCAATCGLHDKASTLFERAKRVAIIDGKNGVLLEACNFNIRVVRKHIAEAQHQDPSWLTKSSANMAREYYTFVNTTAANAQQDAVQLPAHPKTTEIVTPSSPPAPSALPEALCDLIASSLLSNARSSMQADASPMNRTKLCVMVSRPHAAQELAWYFSSMNEAELHRPMEMRVKGEASIDGGYGGVTNDIVGVFFRAVLEMALSYGRTSTVAAASSVLKQHDARQGVTPADHFYSLGVLMVKCFIEGRSFTVLRRLLAYEGIAHFVLASRAFTDASTPRNPTTPLQAFLQWLPDATLRWGSHHAVSSVLLNDLRRLDQETGSNFSHGVEWYWQRKKISNDATEWCEEFLPLCADWIQHVTSIPPGWNDTSATLPDVQRLMFLWDNVLWSRYEVLSNVRRGVSFAANILPDAILSSTLSGVPSATHNAALEGSIVKLFQNTVCGGDAHGPVVTGKDIVERLEFRGWGTDTEAPYMLCSWLHQAAPQMAVDFLALCTGMTALPFEASTSAQPKMPGIIVMPTTMHLYARTCFFTLYIPRWEGCAVAEVHACIDAAVCAYRHSAVMHEVDIS